MNKEELMEKLDELIDELTVYEMNGGMWEYNKEKKLLIALNRYSSYLFNIPEDDDEVEDSEWNP